MVQVAQVLFVSFDAVRVKASARICDSWTCMRRVWDLVVLTRWRHQYNLKVINLREEQGGFAETKKTKRKRKKSKESMVYELHNAAEIR